MARAETLGRGVEPADRGHEFPHPHRREDVVFEQPFADDDRVFEVRSLPRQVTDEDVVPQGEGVRGAGRIPCGRRSQPQDLAARDLVSDLDDRALALAGGQGRGGEATQFAGHFVAVGGANGDRAGGHAGHDPRHRRPHAGAAIADHTAFEPGADQRRLGIDEGHRLLLHVRSHERAVGVVVGDEGDQSGAGTQWLRRMDGRVTGLRVGHSGNPAPRPTEHPAVVPLRVRLPRSQVGDRLLGVCRGRQVNGGVPAPLPVGRQQTSLVVDAGEQGGAEVRPDALAFGGLEKAKPAEV